MTENKENFAEQIREVKSNSLYKWVITRNRLLKWKSTRGRSNRAKLEDLTDLGKLQLGL